MIPDPSPLRLTRAQLRECDRLASAELGIPSLLLMENAARGAAEHALALVHISKPRVLVACGNGNNGGDGHALARWLTLAGAEVRVWTQEHSGHQSSDAAIMAGINRCLQLDSRREAPLANERFDLIIDALLGTGFQGELRPELAEAIAYLNALRREQEIPLVALDLPSGLDADSGRPSTPTIVADLTVTFLAEKTGFAASSARPFLGRVVVAPIGVPVSWVARVQHGLT